MPAAWTRCLLEWMPLLVFVGVLVFVMRRSMAKQKNYMSDLGKYQALHLEELRRQNAALERIAQALERHRGP